MGNVDLNDIRLFVAVVQAGSFSKAADLVNIPKSRLSRRISRLEADLGITLMDRSKRGVLLNEVGEQFYLCAQEMMQAAQAAVNSVQGKRDTPSGLLRLSVSTEVGRGFLMLHLAEYMRRYPDVWLEIEINNKKVNMIQDGIALLPCFDNMLREGWVRLLPEWEVDTVPLYLVYYKNRGSVPTIRSMVNFLVEKFQQDFIK